MVALEELTNKNRKRLLADALRNFKEDTEGMVADLDKLDLEDWKERWLEGSIDYTCIWSKYLSTDMTECVEWLESKDTDFRNKVVVWIKDLLSLFVGNNKFCKNERSRLGVVLLELEKNR